MKDFRISNTLSPEILDATAQLLVQPRLWIPSGDYPAHMEWRNRALAEVESERNRSMVAWYGDEKVGVVIYQTSSNDEKTIEIKNFSINPNLRGRGLAYFLLKQVEHEALVDYPAAISIVADTKRTNPDIISFAISQDFRITDTRILDSTYTHNGVEDVILSKPLLDV